MKNKNELTFYGISNMGLVRTNNEDAFVAQNIWDNDTVLAVAIDGVGGYEGGEVAAAIAQKTIPEYLAVSQNGERVELLKQAVTAANNAICDARENDPDHSQMSCVLTAAIIDMAERQVSMVHVGDSRLYSYHKGVLTKLSHDHSLIGYREEIGDLTEEEAMHHPQRNVIGRDVGSQRHNINDEDFIEAAVFPLKPGTTLLFCSDGLTDMITSAKIKEVLQTKKNLKGKADALINAALAEGGKDNVTVVLVEFKSDEKEDVEPTPEEAAPALEEAVNAEINENVEPAKPHKTNWMAVVIAFILGLIIGAAGMYYCQGFTGEKTEDTPAGTASDSLYLSSNNDTIKIDSSNIEKQQDVEEFLEEFQEEVDEDQQLG